MKTLFVHGVPDTSFMWTPLLPYLGLDEVDTVRLSLPGFSASRPSGFGCTKDEYASWLIQQMEYYADDGGRVRLVGHDWGALLTLRASSLRPDLVESFVVANALIDGQYEGHRLARLWNIPLVGEGLMAVWPMLDLQKGLISAGVPEAVAEHDADCFDLEMRQSILSLYRSANGLRFSGDWVNDLRNLPTRGLILWGELDPFVDIEVAERFQRKWRFPLKVLKERGHWGILEAPEEAAASILEFWRAG